MCAIYSEGVCLYTAVEPGIVFPPSPSLPPSDSPPSADPPSPSPARRPARGWRACRWWCRPPPAAPDPLPSGTHPRGVGAWGRAGAMRRGEGLGELRGRDGCALRWRCAGWGALMVVWQGVCWRDIGKWSGSPPTASAPWPLRRGGAFSGLGPQVPHCFA